jgi:hypothetical protein
MPESALKPLLLPLIVYAACGLALSIAVHFFSFLGLQIGGKALFFSLHIGIFPMWIPVALLSMKLVGGPWGYGRRSYHWEFMLPGCPAWMRFMTRAFYYYAFINFAIFIFWVFSTNPAKLPGLNAIGSANFPSMVWRGFSGHWMLFYSIGLARFTTVYTRGLRDVEQKCLNGHNASLGDTFCSRCGAAIINPAKLPYRGPWGTYSPANPKYPSSRELLLAALAVFAIGFLAYEAYQTGIYQPPVIEKGSVTAVRASDSSQRLSARTRHRLFEKWQVEVSPDHWIDCEQDCIEALRRVAFHDQ